MTYRDRLSGLNPRVLTRIDETQLEVDWIRSATAQQLLDLATDQLGLKPLTNVALPHQTALELGNLTRAELFNLLEPHFDSGTSTAKDLADQVQL